MTTSHPGIFDVRYFAGRGDRVSINGVVYRVPESAWDRGMSAHSFHVSETGKFAISTYAGVFDLEPQDGPPAGGDLTGPLGGATLHTERPPVSYSIGPRKH